MVRRLRGCAPFCAVFLFAGCGQGAVARAQTAAQHPLGWITLGTQGGPAPNAERSEPANVLLVGGKPWIVDCGDGAMERFAAAGFGPTQATRVFISHLHVDHIGGLQGLIALHWFRGAPGSPPLIVYGPPGTDKLVEGIVASLEPTAAIARAEQPEKWSPSASVRTVILQDGSDTLVDGVRVRAVRNSHFDNPPGRPQENGTQSLSYRFDDRGYSIGYTGDTGPSEAVVALEKNADLLVSEVTLRGAGGAGPPGRPGGAAAERGGAEAPVQEGRRGPPTLQQGSGSSGGFHFAYQHLSPGNAGRLAAAANVKHLVFTHLAVARPTEEVAPAIIQATRKVYGGEISVAHDLDRF